MEKDYNSYTWSARELLLNGGFYLAACQVIGWLFYHSLLAGLAGWPGLWLFLKARKKTYIDRQVLSEFWVLQEKVDTKVSAFSFTSLLLIFGCL